MIPFMPILLTSLYLQPGHSWTPNWSDGHNRTLSPMETDPYEKPADVQFSGDGTAFINGSTGTMTLSGNNPRYRVLEPFHNVAVTLYMKRISEIKPIDFAGLVVGVRSRHYTDALCGADTYYGQINWDGTAKLEKELFHASGRDAFFPDVENSNDQIQAFPDSKDGIPRNQWVGIKLTVHNTDNNSAVEMKLYVDRNDSGTWEKLVDYKDSNGQWPVKPGFKNISKRCDGYYPPDKALLDSGFVFIRNDAVDRVDYKNFTITELP